MHLNASKVHAEKFSRLCTEVELFPRKVASALRIKAEPLGFFESVWTGIEEYVRAPRAYRLTVIDNYFAARICMTIWRVCHCRPAAVCPHTADR